LNDYSVIALVVIIVVIAHGWLFLWVKFKMDEGAILKFIQDTAPTDEQANGQLSVSSEIIATHTSIARDRVSLVCRKSRHIEAIPESHEHWARSKR